jgi:GH35 family endo-1,4-beta-xylanase
MKSLRMILSLVVGLMLSMVSLVQAVSAEDPILEAKLAKLPKPVAVVAPQATDWKLKNGGPGVGMMSVVDVEGMPFKQAVRMYSKKRTDRDYNFQAIAPVPEKVLVDEPLLLTFYARATEVNNETSVGQVTIKMFCMNPLGLVRGPQASVAVTSDWQKFYFPWTVFSKNVKELEPGKLTLTLNQGLPPQVVEIADVKVMKFPASVSMSDLPRMEVKLEGREPDAPWRKEAAERIEKIRKGDLTVQVVDGAGQPLPEAQVHVQMKRHAFPWGATFAYFRTQSDDPDNKRYTQEFLELFNTAVLESDMKWFKWVQPKTRQEALAAAHWLKKRDIPLRGHTLVWPQFDRLYDSQDNSERADYYRAHPQEAHQKQLAFIRDIVPATKGLIYEWDVVNEAMTHFDYQNTLGMDVFVKYFKLVRELDPDARLIVNENKLLNPDGGLGRISFSREDDFYTFMKYLKDHGAPVDGIGIQSHGAGGITPPARMLQQLDRFAEFGTISITEFDVVAGEKDQAERTHDFMVMAFSHPAVETFIMWGFWDGQHYRKNAPVFRKDWTLKPSGQVYKDLVFKQWWTNENGTTAVDGSFKLRGFLGDYEITVTSGGKTVTQPLKLIKEGAAVKVVVQ